MRILWNEVCGIASRMADVLVLCCVERPDVCRDYIERCLALESHLIAAVLHSADLQCRLHMTCT